MPGWIEIERVVRRGHYTMAVNHFHDHYEMYYLLSGERYYFIQNKTYHIQKGDLVLIGKQTLHKTADTGLADHERVLISFNSDYLQSPTIEKSLTAAFLGHLHVLHLNVQQQTYIEKLLFELDQEQREQREHHAIYVHAMMQQLLITIHRMYARAQDVFEFVSPTHQRISEMADYINQHYAESLSLSEVSATFHMSASYTSRMFKQVTGFSYIEYMNSVRVKEAQRKLRESKHKVIRIAEEVGFDSVAHFGRVFKQISGLAPMEYRRLNRMNV
ncbi:MAG: AraC family transcriptional regulator [Paenibacillaceae bacterium]